MTRPAIRAVAIGASTGGVHAMQVLLSGLDPQLPACVLLVQHVARDNNALAEVLAHTSKLPLHLAQARQAVANGSAYLAPPGYHLLVERHSADGSKSARLALSVDDKVCFARPSVDVLFESAADVWRAGLIGVILTGANEDGAQGLQTIRRRRGLAIVQSPVEAEMPEMPEQAIQRAGADFILPLNEIAPMINRLCQSGKIDD